MIDKKHKKKRKKTKKREEGNELNPKIFFFMIYKIYLTPGF